MKKLLFFFVGLFLVPFLVSAKTYTQDKLSVDMNSDWEVIMTDEISPDHPLIKEYGIDADTLKRNLESQYVCMDALNFDSNRMPALELFLTIRDVSGINGSFNTMSDSEIQEYADELKASSGALSYEIVVKSGIRWIYLEYVDTSMGVYLDQYLTVVDGTVYTYRVQKSSQFNSADKAKVETVINSTRISGAPAISSSGSGNGGSVVEPTQPTTPAEPEEPTKEKKETKEDDDDDEDSFKKWLPVIIGVGGGVIVLLILLIAVVASKKKNTVPYQAYPQYPQNGQYPQNPQYPQYPQNPGQGQQ